LAVASTAALVFTWVQRARAVDSAPAPAATIQAEPQAR
jgi:hypothetical protein